METDRTLIVVPTYNERENVGALVVQLVQIAPESDVLIIDDNSPDATVVFAQTLFGAAQCFSTLARTDDRSYGRSLLDGCDIAVVGCYAGSVQPAAVLCD